MKTKTVSCLECGENFEAATKEINRGYGKFCTRACAGKNRGRRQLKGTEHWPKHTCATCGVDFKIRPGKRKGGRSGYVFCDRSCKDRAQRIGGIKALHPEHYGEGITGYRKMALRANGAQCGRCGYNRYESILVVHHKDRNRLNNDINNLEVLCRNCHGEDHLLARDGQFSVTPPPGRPNVRRKLTDAQAEEIRGRYADRKNTGELLKDLAAEYGISASSITKIGQGKMYNLPSKLT